MNRFLKLVCLIMAISTLFFAVPKVSANESEDESHVCDEEILRLDECDVCGANSWDSIGCECMHRSYRSPYPCTWATHPSCEIKPDNYYSTGKCQECGHIQGHATYHLHGYRHSYLGTTLSICDLPITAK